MVPVTESFRSLNDATVYVDVYTEAPNTTSSTINIVNSETTYPNQNGTDQVGNELSMNKFPSFYANKLSPKSLTKANLKLEVNVPHGAYYDFASIEGVESVLRNGPWMIFCVKFHDIPLVAYTSNVLSLMATKIGTPMMFDSYSNSMCLESWGWSSYARILVEINACNNFSDHLVMAISNLEGNGYTKEIISSPTRVVNQKDKDKSQTLGADDEGFIEVKKKKIGCNSFETLNDENPIIEEVATGSKDTTSGTQEERQSSTLMVDKIHVIEKRILEGKLMFVDDDRKPLEKIDYPDNLGSDDEVEPVENKIASFLASKSMAVGYGPKSLLEQWREIMWMMTTTHMMMICKK
ncbi:hypothetical protein Tco_0782524, partial [Tanacetum coccineum]